MKAKYKMTGCARFMIFLIILVPIAYFGSKYLRDSGTWDKIKDKVESREQPSSDVNRDDTSLPPIDMSAGNEELGSQFERLRAAYEEQELLLAKQEQTIKNLQSENDALRQRLNATNTGSVPPPATSPTSTNSGNTSGRTTDENSPSLDELLREADSNLGTSPSAGNTGPSSASRTTLGEWDFTYSGTTGVIEFFRQNEKLFSRITVQGDNRLNIEELETRGNRIYVKNSPVGEYYILLSNGNLEAYDQNGFQTTCIRK